MCRALRRIAGRMTFGRILAISIGAAIVLGATPKAAAAAPDPTTAAQRFSEGEAAFSRGDFSAAGLSFEAAYDADPNPSSLFNAAKSWERASETSRAANLYRRFLDEAPNDTPNRDRATAALNELGGRLGRLSIVAPGVHELRLDNASLGQQRSLYVNPGTHLLDGAFDLGNAGKSVTIEAGQSLTVVLEYEAPKKDTGAPARTPAPPPGTGATPWLLFPFAIATALGGALVIWSGADTLYARAQYDSLPDNEKVLTYEQGKFKQDRTNVIVGVTSVLAVTTGCLAVFAIDWGAGHPVVAIGPTEVRLVGSF